MGAHGNSALDHEGHNIGHPTSAFEFDHVCASLHELYRRRNGLIAGLLIATEREIRNDERAAFGASDALGHASGVVAHIFQRHANSGGSALADHTQGIADHDTIDASSISYCSECSVIGGEYRDLLASGAHL